MANLKNGRLPRDLVDWALRASLAELTGEDDIAGLASVLCAAHCAYFGAGDASARKRLLKAASEVLSDQAHHDLEGAQQYEQGHRPVPLGIGPREVDKARYAKRRTEAALKKLARGDLSRELMLADVAASLRFAWPLTRDQGALIVTSEAVADAISKGDSQRIVLAALRAAGVRQVRNLFNADAQKRRRTTR